LVAGLFLLVQENALMASALRALMLTTFALPFLWVSFSPGERQFSSTFSIPFFSVSGPASELLGRLCFAPGALLLAGLAGYLWIKLAREWLRAGEQGDQGDIQ
jgi:hypothetical protein